jgi:hypothetical protein
MHVSTIKSGVSTTLDLPSRSFGLMVTDRAYQRVERPRLQVQRDRPSDGRDERTIGLERQTTDRGTAFARVQDSG